MRKLPINMAAKRWICGQRFLSIKRTLQRGLWKAPSPSIVFMQPLNTYSPLKAESVRKQLFNEKYFKLNDEEHQPISKSKPLDVFVNRNPKNPEYFGYNKQRGYSTQYKKRNFYKRFVMN